MEGYHPVWGVADGVVLQAQFPPDVRLGRTGTALLEVLKDGRVTGEWQQHLKILYQYSIENHLLFYGVLSQQCEPKKASYVKEARNCQNVNLTVTFY